MEKGYIRTNCVLAHPVCHQKIHSNKRSNTGAGGDADELITKRSKRYSHKPYLYWWDITPVDVDKLDNTYIGIQFVKRDNRETCKIFAEELEMGGYLEGNRRSKRGKGNWGVKVLKGNPNELVFFPGTSKGDNLFHKVKWD